MRLGFIGIGTMGGPMCENLMKKSRLTVSVYDVSETAVRALFEKGAEPAADSKEIAERCDIIFTMLPKNEHVRAVYEALLPAVRKGQIYVEMSTVSPDVSREIARQVSLKGAVLLDAPVVKSRPAAVAGTLGIYVGGDQQAYETVLPLLRHMGENVVRLGDNGAGLVMKLCHNMLVAQIQNGVNEMLCLAKKAGGLDTSAFAKAVTYGGASNFYLASKAESLSAGDYTPVFAAEYMHKDVLLAKALCQQCGLTLAGADLAVERYEQALSKGMGKEDFSCTYKLFDEKA